MQYLSILIGNGLLLWTYYGGTAELGELLWIFWSQSVLIGVANAIRMGSLRQFSTEGLQSNGRPVPETAKGKQSAVVFFCLHYGFFHLIYAFFLGSEYGFALLQAPIWAAVALGSFLLGEVWALLRHLSTDSQWRPNLGTLMFTPYLRIVPMHLAIIAGGMLGRWEAASGALLLFFLVLKTIADVGMQLVDEHLDAQRHKAQDAEVGSEDEP